MFARLRTELEKLKEKEGELELLKEALDTEIQILKSVSCSEQS